MYVARNSVVPTSWKLTRIQPVPKKGDLTQISNYRPISLTEVLRKLFERILLPFIQTFIEPLTVEQGGFRQNRGCMDQVATLQQWCSQKHSQSKIMAFLDIKAAYDSVDREIRKRIPGPDRRDQAGAENAASDRDS